MVTCPYCGNTYSIMSHINNMYYCSKCGFYFRAEPTLSKAGTFNLLNTSTADIEDNKLTINAKDIIINDDKISITIDKDNIDKFDVIEINGTKFVRCE